MFIIGLLAFFQMVFIPGFIALKYPPLRRAVGDQPGDLVRRLVYGFGLSLLINYLLVFALTAAGLYTAVSLYIVLLIELAIIIQYYRNPPSKDPWRFHFKIDSNRAITVVKEFLAERPRHYGILLVMLAAVLLWYLFLFYYFLGTVFEHWDPVTGWNRFATDWARNIIPNQTWRYPQVVPANWSITYVMIGTSSVVFFAKSIMPFFSIASLLLFLDLALTRKKSVYLLSGIFYGLMLAYLYQPSVIASGYMDIPVSFFALLSFHSLTRFRRTTPGRPFVDLALPVLLASTAAVVKQAGLFFLIIALAWSFREIFKQHRNNLTPNSSKKIIVSLLLLLVIPLTVTAPWYVLKEIQIDRGIDQSALKLIQKANRHDGYVKRLKHGFKELATLRHPKLEMVILGLGLLILLGLFHPKSWRVTCFVVIPYTLLWGFFFSYDHRNLTPAIPFMAYSAAFGVLFLKSKLPAPGNWPRLELSFIPLAVSALVVLFLMGHTVFNRDTLIRHQTRLQKEIGDSELNRLLYEYHEKEGLTGLIATNYQYLNYLPELKKYYYRKDGRLTLEFMDYLETEDGKGIHYLLVPRVVEKEKKIHQKLKQNLKSGHYRMIFKWRGYRFIGLNKSFRGGSRGAAFSKGAPLAAGGINE